jgi:hypothetical protein
MLRLAECAKLAATASSGVALAAARRRSCATVRPTVFLDTSSATWPASMSIG